MTEHDYRCAHGCGVPEIDAAQRAYERNWPGRCWHQASDLETRVYLEVEALKAVEEMRERVRGGEA